MYKNIVVAIDGSDVSTKAFEHALELAQFAKAKLTAVTVTEPFEALAFAGEASVYAPSDYEKLTQEQAAGIFAKATETAKARGVDFTTVHRHNRFPYDGIIETAKDVGADLIIVGSHGRRGIEGLLLGSQAVKLLTHTQIPALVVR